MEKQEFLSNTVARSTEPQVNERIQKDIQKNILYYASNPDQIDTRITEVENEWDIERALEMNASVFALSGLVLGVLGRKGWLMLPIVVLSFLIQHAVRGWCPPIVIFRRLGMRTRDEILFEKNSLRALRGDFDQISDIKSKAAAEKARDLFDIYRKAA